MVSAETEETDPRVNSSGGEDDKSAGVNDMTEVGVKEDCGRWRKI